MIVQGLGAPETVACPVNDRRGSRGFPRRYFWRSRSSSRKSAELETDETIETRQTRLHLSIGREEAVIDISFAAFFNL